MRMAIVHCSLFLLLSLLLVGCGSDGLEPSQTTVPTDSLASDTPTPTPTAAPTPTPTTAPTPTPTPEPDRYALLENLAIEFGTTFADKHWATLYQLQPPSFQEKCPANEFIELMLLFDVFGEMPDDMEFVLESVRIEGNTGYVEARFEKEGVSWGEGSEEDPEPFAFWEDGEWVLGNWLVAEDNEKPCEISLD